MKRLHNPIFYALKDSTYSAAMLFVNGSMLQLFLAYKGLSSAEIGMISSAIQIVTTAITLLMSNLAERCGNVMKTATRLILGQAILFVFYLPLAAIANLSVSTVLWTILVLVIVQTTLNACKAILEYRIMYHIVPLDQITSLFSFNGIVIGLFSMGAATLYSSLLANYPGSYSYLICMIIANIFLFGSTFCFGRIKPVNLNEPEQYAAEKKPKVSVRKVLLSKQFLYLLIPNCLRGINYGIFGSMTLIAIASGLTHAEAARMSVMSSLSVIISYFLYFVLTKYLKPAKTGLIGSLLLCVCFFQTAGSANWFLALYCISYIGKSLMDNDIAVLVMHFVDAEIAGVYNAWRNMLGSAVSALTVFLVGLVVDTINPLFLLIPYGLVTVFCMGWYYIMYHKFTAK